jgi:hypothetical protein
MLEPYHIAELREAFQKLPPIPDSNVASQQRWYAYERELRRLVATDDPQQFLRWGVIRETMCIEHAGYAALELSHLRSRRDWAERWAKAIIENDIGQPLRSAADATTSDTLLTHAYHVAMLEEKTACRADALELVVEFGGGYGSMCRLFRNLGFAGVYMILDLPAFSALQRFYLAANGYSLHNTVLLSDPGIFADTVREYRAEGRSAFVGTWSVSETSNALRTKVLDAVTDFEYFLFGYQAAFDEMDNAAWFAGWCDAHPQVNWVNWLAKHLPDSNYYLVGSRSCPTKPGI